MCEINPSLTWGEQSRQARAAYTGVPITGVMYIWYRFVDAGGVYFPLGINLAPFLVRTSCEEEEFDSINDWLRYGYNKGEVISGGLAKRLEPWWDDRLLSRNGFDINGAPITLWRDGSWTERLPENTGG